MAMRKLCTFGLLFHLGLPLLLHLVTCNYGAPSLLALTWPPAAVETTPQPQQQQLQQQQQRRRRCFSFSRYGDAEEEAETVGGRLAAGGTVVCDGVGGGGGGGEEEDEVEEEEVEEEEDGGSRRGFCYAAWRNVSGDVQLERQGCWVHDCRGRSKCVESSSNPFVYFCCCDRDLCNVHFALRPRAHEGTQQPTPVAVTTTSPPLLLLLLLLLLPLLPLSVWTYRRCHKLLHATTPSQEAVRLLELKAGGRFSCIWRAQLLSEVVAVKIVQPVNQRLWRNELDIFGTLGLSHRNLLEFIGTERREGNAGSEMWIITAFHERGSLSDHLKCSTLSWAELCHIGETLACGLAHLHHHVHGGKPAIAHRDFKSNNVLLRSDLSAVIADFGLALKFQPGRSLDDIPRVGTPRYMAPELLDGAVRLRREAFLRIDVYALGLVLWEVATRCEAAAGGVLGEYRAPFADEVGDCPTLHELRHFVVNGNGRPAIQEAWLKHPGLSQLCVTMEECWDQDAEARLSAHCVEQRLAQLRTDPGLPGGSGGTTAAHPPTTTTTAIVTAPPPTTTIVTAHPPTITTAIVTAPPPTITTIVTAPPPTTVTAPPPTTVTAPPPTTSTARPLCSDPGVVVRLSTLTPPSLLLLVAPIEESSL